MILPTWITYPLYFVGLMKGLVLSSLLLQEEYGIKYTQSATVPYDAESMPTYELEYPDTVSGETLYQVNSHEDRPVFYFSRIRTGVCLDDECRPLDVVVYWNITGRYLGFALPKEEFLSKYDHEPFISREYERLHTLLADSLLPLADVSFEELIQEPDSPASHSTEVDAVSGATSREVLDYVVEGAAYTTYKLWNIVYGSSQDLVRSLTLDHLSDTLLTAILQSPDVGDRFWALNHLRRIPELTPPLHRELLNCITDQHYSLGVAALKAIDSSALRSDSLQRLLLEKFYQCDYGLKMLIADKLKEAPSLSEPVIRISSRNLSSLSGQLLQSILDLYRTHQIADKETLRRVANLLNGDNRFVSQKAFHYLNEVETIDPEVRQQMSAYLDRDTNPVRSELR